MVVGERKKRGQKHEHSWFRGPQGLPEPFVGRASWEKGDPGRPNKDLCLLRGSCWCVKKRE